MKNLSLQFFQKVLLFGLLLFTSHFTFAQTLTDPVVVTTSQTVNYDEEVSLVASCAQGDLKWYEEALVTPALTDLTPNVKKTTTYLAVCESSCTCERSNAVEVIITVDVPFNITRSQSLCSGTLELKASCPRGVVTWYETSTANPLGMATTISPGSPGTQTTYLVTCVNTNVSPAYESPTEEFIIYAPSGGTHTDPTPPVIPLTACLGGSVTLTANCSSGNPIFYTSNNTTEISALVNNSPASATYLARCEDENMCPSGFVEIDVTASAPPTPTGISSPSPVCIGESVGLTATCDGSSEVKWYMNDGISPVLDVSALSPAATITYKVRCESTDFTDCFGAFGSVTITVKNDITLQPTSTLVCLGSEATFVVAVINSPTLQWQKKQADGTYLDIPSANSATLTIANTVLADRGYYRCFIDGECDYYTDEVFLAFPQTILSKNKVAPNGVTVEDEFASSVAVSNGFAIVGAPGKNIDSHGYSKGAAYIYKMNPDGKWSQMALLSPIDLEYGDYFGTSVALSGDYAFIGAPDQDLGAGAVYVYKKQLNNTWLLSAKLYDAGGMSGDYFGDAMEATDKFLAVSQPSNDKIFIYRNNAGTWTNEYEIQEGSNGLGGPFAISENTIAIGTPTEMPAGGIVTYDRDNSGIWHRKEHLVPSGISSAGLFGFSVALSGNTMLGSGISFFDSSLLVYVFERSASGNWIEKTTLTSTDMPDEALLGSTLAIHDNIAVLGAPLYNGVTGASVVFERNSIGNWVQKMVVIPDNLAEGDAFGAAIAIDKNSLIISSSTFSLLNTPTTGVGNKGAAYFYQLFTFPAPAVASVSQAAAVCPSLKTTFNLTGLPSTDPYTISYKIDEGGTTKTVVVTPDSTGKASFTETFVWANNTRNIYFTKVKNNTSNCETVIDLSSEIAVKAPTEITGNPIRQIVCVGETAVFTGEATGEGNLIFQWQRQSPTSNGFNLPLNNDFSDLSVLTLANRTLADNGARYRVKVTGECGVVTSSDALLIVHPKAVVTMTAGAAVCPGSAGTLSFTGTPFANVTYQANGAMNTISLDAEGVAIIATNALTAETTFNLVSIDIEGKCNKSISGSAVIAVLPSGSTILPPLVLTNPGDNVAATVVQTKSAQSLVVSSIISTGGKATHTGNKYIMLGEGFMAADGSVYEAKVTPACP